MNSVRRGRAFDDDRRSNVEWREYKSYTSRRVIGRMAVHTHFCPDIACVTSHRVCATDRARLVFSAPSDHGSALRLTLTRSVRRIGEGGRNERERGLGLPAHDGGSSSPRSAGVALPQQVEAPLRAALGAGDLSASRKSLAINGVLEARRAGPTRSGSCSTTRRLVPDEPMPQHHSSCSAC